MLGVLVTIAACHRMPVATDTDLGTDADTDTDTDADSDTDTDADVDTDVACTASIVSISPVDHAVDVLPDRVVVATFSAPATAFTLAIPDVTGEASLAADGRSATFVPAGALALDTTYRVAASVCGGPVVETTFHTVEGPISPNVLAGRTYAIDLETVTWLHPALAAAFVGGIKAELMLVEAVSFDETHGTMNALGAYGETVRSGVIQTPCLETMTYDAADFSDNPRFVIGPAAIGLDTDWGDIRMESFMMTATFASGGDEIVDIDLTADVDTRLLDDAAGFDVCEVSASLGDACVTCADGVDKCLPTEITSATAPWIPDLALDPDLPCR
jgi:hypothetical protein